MAVISPTVVCSLLCVSIIYLVAASPVARRRHGFGQCDLCADDVQWVFILGTGRSGSTTILDMMNSIPGVDVNGENDGLMTDLRHIYAKLDALQSIKADAWKHHDVDFDELLCDVQQVVRTSLGFDPSRVWAAGFKEVRHHEIEDLDFFRKAFPCARFIVNYRKNITTQLESQEALGWENTDFEIISEHTRHLKAWAELNSDVTLQLPLEDFSVDTFNQVLPFLGVSNCTFTEVLHANQAYSYGQSRPVAEMDGSCSLPNSFIDSEAHHFIHF
eukprot:CAMPEP_0178459736 /NCGR_PEP_ID=MMETSP0689_2-20121128/48302_1 /TAXON_ID=160604 /ORGANISM="Amphidinium massartii, Strain CS-259" /LENGTH=272 /DNA_ID=CAMNT_0020086259 /DNA_START=126 /DNA_END=944 /DNA_ORIENTATION=-